MKTIIGIHDRLLLKLSFVIKIGFLSIFEWPLETGLAVTENPILETSSCTHMCICVHVGTPCISLIFCFV